MATLEHLTKEEWLIRLMQGMVGNYGTGKRDAQCFFSYSNAMFMIRENNELRTLDVNYISPRATFWITDTKGIEVQPIQLHNIGR